MSSFEYTCLATKYAKLKINYKQRFKEKNLCIKCVVNINADAAHC